MLEKSNSDAFNDEIGSITNRGSEMTALMASFHKDSKEYKTLYRRCQYTMKAQQDEIDAGKGIQSVGMPKEWFDYKVNKILPTDSEEMKQRKEFNLNILANKKPYYFIYNYPSLKKELNNYIKNGNWHCRIRYNMDIQTLENKEDITEEQKTFLEYCYKRNPVDTSPSVMNKLCAMMESEFDGYKQESTKDLKFNHNILKSGEKYSKTKYNKVRPEIEKIYKEYIKDVQSYMRNYKSGTIADSKISASQQRKLFVLEFVAKCKKVEANMQILTDIIIDICYNSNKNKQFVWDVCGEQIIQNLLGKHDNKILFLEQCDNGEIIYNGLKFKPKYIKYEVVDESDIEREIRSSEDVEE